MADLKKRLAYHEPACLSDVDLEDAGRIVEICAVRGYSISMEEAHSAWEDHSSDYHAGFLFLGPDDDVIFEAVKGKCREVTA